MIKYLCDACGEDTKNITNYDKYMIEGKHYCDKCAPKVTNIINTLQSEYTDKLNADHNWYKTEKERLIATQCPTTLNVVKI